MRRYSRSVIETADGAIAIALFTLFSSVYFKGN
jgi:hypothetical protein